MASKRNWQPREMRMLAEYLASKYSKYPYQTRIRLGSIPVELIKPGMDPVEKRMAGLWRRWADAIVFKPDELIVIEAAIKPSPGDISQLQLYEKLVHHTPELEPFGTQPVALELVYAIEDPIVLELARQAKIRVVYFKPTWLSDYMRILYPRERRATLTNKTDLTG